MPARFWNAHIVPPRSGWTYPIGGVPVTRYTEDDIVAEIRKYQQNNGTYEGEEPIREALWAYYCANEPERCQSEPGVPAVIPATYQAPLVPAQVTPALQGPPIWTFLNTLAVQWRPELRQYFLNTCEAITAMLECPTCRNEWRFILQEMPPTNVNSRLAACQWVNNAHNRVNDRRGVARYPYEKMVTEFGAPIPA